MKIKVSEYIRRHFDPPYPDRRTVIAWIKSGQLNGERLGNQWFVTEEIPEAETAQKAMVAARHRAKTLGRAYELTAEEEESIILRSGGKCELTGIQFSDKKPRGCRKAPFKPSLDRISSRRGYTYDNVRLICSAMNNALGQWGEPVFRRIAESYLDKGKNQ